MPPSSNSLGAVRPTGKNVAIIVSPPIAEARTPDADKVRHLLSRFSCIFLVIAGVTVGVWAALND